MQTCGNERQSLAAPVKDMKQHLFKVNIMTSVFSNGKKDAIIPPKLSETK